MSAARPSVSAALPTVSVVIPNHDYERFLPAAIASALEQPGVEVEVIVVDDASHDGSVALVQALQGRDARIRLIEHPVNRGHIITYNDGLAAASGDHVVLLSADDLLAPGALARSAAVLEADARIGLVYGYADSFSGEAPTETGGRSRRSSRWSGQDWIARMCRRGTNLVVNPEAMMRRSVLERIGGYDPALPQTADMLLWMQAAAVSDVGRVNGPVQAHYRVHGGNMHLTSFAGDLRELRARQECFEWFFAGSGAQLEGAEALLGRARASIAREAARRAVRLAGEAEAGDLRDPSESAGSGDPADAAGSDAQQAAAGFAAAAVLADPVVARAVLRDRIERRALHLPPRVVREAERRREELASALRWRRWRRFGT